MLCICAPTNWQQHRDYDKSRESSDVAALGAMSPPSASRWPMLQLTAAPRPPSIDTVQTSLQPLMLPPNSMMMHPNVNFQPKLNRSAQLFSQLPRCRRLIQHAAAVRTDALLGRSKGPLEAITMIGSSLKIYHSPLHPRMRFHPCTGCQSRIVQSHLCPDSLLLTVFTRDEYPDTEP